MLTGQGLSRRFAGGAGLADVDVEVHPGGITAVVGPSGSGKTTLIRTLSLLDPPTSGVISVDGKTYRFPLGRGVHIEPPWPKVTVVFQQLFLWPHLTLRGNLRLALRRHPAAEAEARIANVIATFEMADFVDRFPNQTSLGQRQRAALARALVLQPSYVLLDEITSSLDVRSIAVLLAYLKTLREQGIGILLVTHLTGFARRAANRVIFLENGRVLESGGPEVLEAPANERVRRFLETAHEAQ